MFSFGELLEHVFDYSVHTQFLVDDLNDKLATQNIFKGILGSKRLYETDHDNNVWVGIFATSKDLTAQHTMFL